MAEREFVIDGRTYRSIDDVPEPHRSAMSAAFSAPGPPAPATAGGQALVRPARISSRAKLIVGFVLLDMAIAAVAVWWLTS